MPTFKKQKILSGLFVLNLALVGCTIPSPQSTENAEENAVPATFKVQADFGKSKSIETQVQGAFALPTNKIFNLVACIKDIAYDKAVQNHEFEIVEATKKSTTDKDGCLTWSEDFSYNYLADSRYIKITRTIKGTKWHKGEQKISFAINPWSHDEKLSDVLDPDDGNEIPLLVTDENEVKLTLKGLQSDNKPIQKHLWVDEGRVFITEQKITPTSFNYDIEVHPKVSIPLGKVNGAAFYSPLASGKFNARLKLIHTYMAEKEIHRLMSESTTLPVSMTNGNLSIKTSMSMLAMPSRGQFYLALELEPVEAPVGLQGFTGLYYVSEYDGLKSAGFLKLSNIVSQNASFNLDQYINSRIEDLNNSSPNTPEQSAPQALASSGNSKTSAKEEKIEINSDIYFKPKVQIGKIEFEFLRVGQEQTSRRQIYYTAKACFAHPVDQKTIRKQTFTITKFRSDDQKNETKVEKTTDSKSCVIWDEEVSFDYFSCHHYLKGNIRIQNTDLGVDETLGVLINPWETWGNNFGRDLRYVDANEKLPMSCQTAERPRTQIVLDGFSYNTESYKYKIDPLLNLILEKKILLRMDARMMVYSSLSSGWSDPQRLRDGIYLLKTALIKNKDYNENRSTLVTATEKLVQVVGGQVNTSLTYEVQDLKSLWDRNNILIELYPVDEAKVLATADSIQLKESSQPLDSAIDQKTELQSPTFIGNIVLNSDDGNRVLKILDNANMADIFLQSNATNKNQVKTQSHLISKIVEQGMKDKADLQRRVNARSAKSVFVSENNVDMIDLRVNSSELPMTQFVKDSKVSDKDQLTRSEINSLLLQGTISTETAQKMCALWSKDFWRLLYRSKGGVNYGWMDGFGLSCYHEVKKNAANIFQLDRRMFIKSVASYKYLGGENQGYSVGSSFTKTKSHSTYVTRAWSWSAKMGLSKKFLDLLSLGTDVGFSISSSVSDSNSDANSASLNDVKSLMVQKNNFLIRVNKYEQCAIVRLNPALFAKDPQAWVPKTDYSKFINPELTDEEKAIAITRGLMFCEGEDRISPVDLQESYYLVNQETYTSGQQDSGDERNRRFFVAIRSQNDFLALISTLRAYVKGSDVADSSKQNINSISLENLFKTRSPSYPGVYRN